MFKVGDRVFIKHIPEVSSYEERLLKRSRNLGTVVTKSPDDQMILDNQLYVTLDNCFDNHYYVFIQDICLIEDPSDILKKML